MNKVKCVFRWEKQSIFDKKVNGEEKEALPKQ